MQVTDENDCTRTCDIGITSNTREDMLAEYERKFHKPGPTDRIIRDLHSNKINSNFIDNLYYLLIYSLLLPMSAWH
jgi:hypothetical protein